MRKCIIAHISYILFYWEKYERKNQRKMSLLWNNNGNRKKITADENNYRLFACLYLNEILFCEYFNYFDFSVCWLCILVRSEVMALIARQGKNETRSFEYATPYGYYLLLISLVRFCIIPAFYVFFISSFFVSLCLPPFLDPYAHYLTCLQLHIQIYAIDFKPRINNSVGDIEKYKGIYWPI